MKSAKKLILPAWPKGIYLEASILVPLPLYVINAEIERLKQLGSSLNASIYIPEVSFKEWIDKRKEQVKKYLQNVENGLSNMSRLFDYVKMIKWEKEKQSIVEDMEVFTRKILNNNGITVIQTPQIKLEKLLDMSINKVRPFEESNEKGFRDSLNLFTVLEQAQNQRDHSHCFIARDNVYQHEDIQNLAKQYNVKLVIMQSIASAISVLEKYIEQVEKKIDTYKKSVLINFLLKNTDKISQYIKQNGQFTQSFLNQNYQLGYFPQIKGITDINVIDIPSVTRGVLPKDSTSGRVKISFTAKTKFIVLVKEIPPPPPEPRIKYGQPAANLTFPSYFWSLGFEQDQFVNKEVKIDIPMEGSVILTRQPNQQSNLEDQYSDLEIDNMIL